MVGGGIIEMHVLPVRAWWVQRRNTAKLPVLSSTDLLRKERLEVVIECLCHMGKCFELF